MLKNIIFPYLLYIYYSKNNQGIPFKLKNIYNTPCDPKKDLDFKMTIPSSNHSLANNGETKNISKKIHSK